MAKKNSDTIREVLRDIHLGESLVGTTPTRTIWSKKHDDGSVEETTQTTREFTIKPSKTGAKLGAIAGAVAGGVIGEYIPFIGGHVCAAVGAIIGGIAGWIFGPA